jgi:hypothetical protein
VAKVESEGSTGLSAGGGEGAVLGAGTLVRPTS